MDENLLVNQHLSGTDKTIAYGFVARLNELVDLIAEQKSPELAIECLHHYDNARKKLDRVQASPYHGARTEIERYKV